MKKYIYSILFLFLLFIAFVGVPSAQENSETQAKKYGITFPIAELGNCNSISECKIYCDDTIHRDTCISFAKKKGFYKDVEHDTKRQALLQSAKSELGCDSEESCKAVCQQEANIEKCQQFAKKNGLGEGPQNPGDKKILEKAKSLLGCDSESSCKAVCEQEANKEKCSEFAKQTGLGGGIHQVGPGGCNSEESCRAFCEKNPDECKKFGGENKGPQGQRKGPGGCDSEESCRKYCSEHPQECTDMKKNSEFINGRPTGQFNNSEDYCRSHPEECKRREGMQNQQHQQFVLPQGTRPPEQSQQNVEQRGEFHPSQEVPQGEKPPESQPGTSTYSDVKGVKTQISLLQKLLRFFFR